jgi:16S rRNA (cytosine967-C5)-methyltransferase
MPLNKMPAANPAPPTSRALADQLLDTARCVAAVAAGRSLTDALAEVPPAHRPGVQALAFHSLRRLAAARAASAALVERRPAPALQALLEVALALLWRIAPSDTLPYAPHTVVDQAVQAARRSRAAPGFVNATLRRFLREEAALRERLLADPTVDHNLPHWWIEQLQRDWPEHWQDWAQAARSPPPLTLRVNRRQADPERVLDELRLAGQAAEPLGGDALRMRQPVPVERLPGFAEGRVSVQDRSAQRAGALALALLAEMGADQSHPARPLRVLDACAAPGGKAAHILEQADVELLALDVDAARVGRLRDTLQRLHLKAEVRHADAAEPRAWWDGVAFDLVLLDAPCSGSGVVRRHADIPWLRRKSDLKQLSQQQDRLLDALWPLVAPGGWLMYLTCSIFRVEGEQRIDAFLQRHGDARPDPSRRAPGHTLGLAENGTDPASNDDGFFYSLLQRPRRSPEPRDAASTPDASPAGALAGALAGAPAAAPAGGRATGQR